MKTGTRQVKVTSPLRTRAIKPKALTTFKGRVRGMAARDPKNIPITKGGGKKSRGTGIHEI
jgi:hypothetical protein